MGGRAVLAPRNGLRLRFPLEPPSLACLPHPGRAAAAEGGGAFPLVSQSERVELRRRDVDGSRLEGRDDSVAMSNLETPPSIIIQLERELHSSSGIGGTRCHQRKILMISVPYRSLYRHDQRTITAMVAGVGFEPTTFRLCAVPRRLPSVSQDFLFLRFFNDLVDLYGGGRHPVFRRLTPRFSPSCFHSASTGGPGGNSGSRAI